MTISEANLATNSGEEDKLIEVATLESKISEEWTSLYFTSASILMGLKHEILQSTSMRGSYSQRRAIIKAEMALNTVVAALPESLSFLAVWPTDGDCFLGRPDSALFETGSASASVQLDLEW